MAEKFLDFMGDVKSETDLRESGLFSPRNAEMKQSPEYQQNFLEAVRFVDRIQSGKAPLHQFHEAMTRSDFPLYFGDILDRSVMASYRAANVMWRQISDVATVNDFRTKAIHDFNGPDAFLSEVVPEKTPYPMSAVTEGRTTYALQKVGRIFDVSWETIVNDDLSVFQKIPQWFATAAIRTEERFHTSLYAAAGGPNAALYNAPGGAVVNGNLGTGVLNVNNLGIAIASMGMMIDPESNEPIFNTPRYLVVPPSLELSAKRILNSVNLVWQVATRDAGGAADAIRPFPTSNFLQNTLQLIVNPYLPLMDAVTGMTAWYLFASPTELPATEVGFLRGYEAPQIFTKAPDQQRVGGGAANVMDGDFATDNIKYKVRHVLGGTQVRSVAVVDGVTRGVPATYASTGTTATITNWPDNTAVTEPVA